MSPASLNASTVRDMQDRVEREARRRAKRAPMSRAARLFLVKRLSENSGGGLGLLGGMIACLAILAGLAEPARALIWAAMAAPALYACRRILQGYKVGGPALKRPFHWRADYVAALCVLGAAFGSGAMLLAPADASLLLSVSVTGAVLTATLAAALAHAAHLPAALALWLPAVAFSVAASLRTDIAGLSVLATTAIGVIGIGLVAYGVNRFGQSARVRHPIVRGPRRDAGADADFDADIAHAG